MPLHADAFEQQCCRLDLRQNDDLYKKRRILDKVGTKALCCALDTGGRCSENVTKLLQLLPLFKLGASSNQIEKNARAENESLFSLKSNFSSTAGLDKLRLVSRIRPVLSDPPNAFHLFFKHHVSDCGQQYNMIGCCPY